MELFPCRALELRALCIELVREAAAVSFLAAAQKVFRHGKALRSQVYVILTGAVRDIQLGDDDLVQEGRGAVALFRRCEKDSLQLRGSVRDATIDSQPVFQNALGPGVLLAAFFQVAEH